ncbi:hypothetical protein FACS189447_01890 [Spirochaetia bacterium]|nr:hypothetical protein FACS189447_01890 [Spirochaetia bacterium]
MKKYCVFTILLAALFSAPLFSQAIINPSDPLYTDFQIWETQGLIANLPALRPYPVQLIQSLLNRVIENGPAQESEKAGRHYERLFSKKVHAGASGIAAASIDDEMDLGLQVDLALLSLGSFSIFDNLSFSYDANVFITNKNDGEALIPKYSGYHYETYGDNTSVGPIQMFVPFNGAAFYGTEDMWFQAGMSRSSWGDFYDNGVVLSPDAPHTGNLSFVINQTKWNYTQSLFILTASTETGDGRYPEKFLSMHSISAYPRSWIEITYYENAVYGQRFEPIYLLPAPYMLSQQLIGLAGDNIQMGLAVKYKPIKKFAVALNIFLDDLEFGDVFKLKFDTKIRMADQLGIIWAPGTTNISSILLDYTLITPYTYAHYDYSHHEDYGEMVQVNYQNYTHNGRSLATGMPPNSDRISLTGNFVFFKDLRLKTNFTFIRHANVNESLPEENVREYLDPSPSQTPNDYETNTDGGILDAPNAGNGQFRVSHSKLMFMEQPTKQYTFQIGLDAVWDLPRFDFGTISLMAGYSFEFIYNDGVDSPMFHRVSPSPLDYEAEIAAQKAAWRNGLHNTMKHYITVGMKWVY